MERVGKRGPDLPRPRRATGFSAAGAGQGPTAARGNAGRRAGAGARVTPGAHPLIRSNVWIRLRHARGQSLPGWLMLCSGEIGAFPDGVAEPESDAEVRERLDCARCHQVTVIPVAALRLPATSRPSWAAPGADALAATPQRSHWSRPRAATGHHWRRREPQHADGGADRPPGNGEVRPAQVEEGLKPCRVAATGQLLGRKWVAKYCRSPCRREPLWQLGYTVDTLETAVDGGLAARGAGFGGDRISPASGLGRRAGKGAGLYPSLASLLAGLQPLRHLCLSGRGRLC